MATRECIPRLMALGITESDAADLRRASMTLRRWFELECGDSNQAGAWSIVRGDWEVIGRSQSGKATKTFRHNDDGAAFMERHHYFHGRAKDSVSYSKIPDREAGARKRIAATLAQYPDLTAYVQTDPRGASLFVMRKADIAGQDVSSVYSSRGVAVYQ